MPDLSVEKNLPDVSFIDGATVEDIRREMVEDYEAFMEQETGRPIKLDRASPHRMELYAAAAQIYQAMQYIDRAGKQNLLKYSYSDFLDHLAAFKGLARDPAAAAATTLRFTLSAARRSRATNTWRSGFTCSPDPTPPPGRRQITNTTPKSST